MCTEVVKYDILIKTHVLIYFIKIATVELRLSISLRTRALSVNRKDG